MRDETIPGLLSRYSIAAQAIAHNTGGRQLEKRWGLDLWDNMVQILFEAAINPPPAPPRALP